jgi:hypothetical protein
MVTILINMALIQIIWYFAPYNLICAPYNSVWRAHIYCPRNMKIFAPWAMKNYRRMLKFHGVFQNKASLSSPENATISRCFSEQSVSFLQSKEPEWNSIYFFWPNFLKDFCPFVHTSLQVCIIVLIQFNMVAIQINMVTIQINMVIIQINMATKQKRASS